MAGKQYTQSLTRCERARDRADGPDPALPFQVDKVNRLWAELSSGSAPPPSPSSALVPRRSAARFGSTTLRETLRASHRHARFAHRSDGKLLAGGARQTVVTWIWQSFVRVMLLP